MCVWVVCTGVCVCVCVRSRASQITSLRAKRGERTEKKNFPEEKRAVREENLNLDGSLGNSCCAFAVPVLRKSNQQAGAAPRVFYTESFKLLRRVLPSRPGHLLRVRV